MSYAGWNAKLCGLNTLDVFERRRKKEERFFGEVILDWHSTLAEKNNEPIRRHFRKFELAVDRWRLWLGVAIAIIAISIYRIDNFSLPKRLRRLSI